MLWHPGRWSLYRRRIIMGEFGWIRKCRHCGYFCYGHPLNGPCPDCGALHIAATGETWESLIGKIETTYTGKWWKPLTWFNESRKIVYPKYPEKYS